MSKTITGQINRILFYNEENGYTVAIFSLEDKATAAQKKLKLVVDSTTVVGLFDRIPYEGEEYELVGDYVNDKNYGYQFRISSFTRKKIDNEYGVVSYLSSDMFPSIGPKIARQIIKQLGINCIEEMRKHPEKIQELTLSDAQKKVLSSGILSDHGSQEAIIFLLNHGITMDMAHKAIAKWGDKTLNIVKSNPYILMENLSRFGFKKNDAFALSMGIEKTSEIRLHALMVYLIHENIYSSGNSYFTENELYEIMNRYLDSELNRDVYLAYLKKLNLEKKIVYTENHLIFDASLYEQEVHLANDLAELLQNRRSETKKIISFTNEEINQAYDEIKQDEPFELNDLQKEAVHLAFTKPIVIITGGPGTGKTTIVHTIIRLYLKLYKDNKSMVNAIALLAPTGRAAKRLNDLTKMEASTIHKYLGYTGDNHFEYSEYNKTSSKLVLVDESSMMDVSLAYHLVSSMQEDARLILVGDVDQLPSVGPGQVLKDLIDSKEIPTVTLSYIHRQKKDSTIIELAHKVNNGELPADILEKKPDRAFIEMNRESLPSMVVKVVKKATEKGLDVLKDVQVLIPMYKGPTGINEINNLLQQELNPKGPDLKNLGRIFRVNDKVIQLVNHADKNIMNGDIGIITDFIYEDQKIVGLNVRYDFEIVSYNLDELEEISLAYAISIHKSQGSEFDHVVMPISTEHYIMLKKKLLYTAITRAKKSLTLLGDIKAFYQGIHRLELPRKTILKEEFIQDLHGNQKPKVDILSEMETNKEVDPMDLLSQEHPKDEIKLEDFSDEIILPENTIEKVKKPKKLSSNEKRLQDFKGKKASDFMKFDYEKTDDEDIIGAKDSEDITASDFENLQIKIK